MIKRLSLLLSLFCLSVIGARAATVSGTVTNLSLSAPAAGQTVYLIDSVTTLGLRYLDTTITNSSGAYSFTVSSSITSGRFQIMTYACGSQKSSPYNTYSGSSLTINLGICPFVLVNGTVTYSGPLAAANTKVYLNDSNNTLGVTYRDSTVTNSAGQYVFTVPAYLSMYRVYAKACGTRFNSLFYNPSTGNKTINLSLFCPWLQIRDTVKNSSTGVRVYGQKVYLLDSTATSYRLDSTTSDIYGIAYFSVPPTTAPGTLRVFTYSCGLQSSSFSYSGSSMTGPTLSICASNTIITGTVTNATTSAVVAGQSIVVFDSLGTTRLYMDTAFTNASGVYTITVPVSVPATGTMIAETYACGIRHTSTGSYTGSNMTLNLSVCSSSAATISGIVNDWWGKAPIAGRKVYLVDTITSGTGGIVYRDSTTTNSSGFYSFSIPPSVMSGYFLISVPSCGTMSWNNVYYYGISAVRNFTVCGSTTQPTVTGTIIDPKGAPIAGATVSINSSLTTTTSSSGTYSLTIPTSLGLGSTFTWRASNSCGTRAVTLVNTGSNLVESDTLYNQYCYTIGGTITKQGGGAAAYAKVYLIGEFQDTSTTPPSTVIYAVDSTISNTSGQYSFTKTGYWIMPQRIKAALQSSDPSYWNYLPTYGDSALNWSSADTFTGNTWVMGATNLNVSLRAGTNPGGPAFIGGNVLMGANKSTAVGDPLSRRILLLTTDKDVAVGFTYSDASGAFSFPNLPYGTYKLFGDAGGKTNPPLMITLSAAAPTVNSVVFEENSSTFKGHIGNVGVGTQKSDEMRLYPNPAGAYVMLNGLKNISGNKTISIKNVAGATVYSVEVTSGDVLSIPTEKLPAGMYLLQLHSDSGVRNFRFAKN